MTIWLNENNYFVEYINNSLKQNNCFVEFSNILSTIKTKDCYNTLLYVKNPFVVNMIDHVEWKNTLLRGVISTLSNIYGWSFFTIMNEWVNEWMNEWNLCLFSENDINVISKLKF